MRNLANQRNCVRTTKWAFRLVTAKPRTHALPPACACQGESNNSSVQAEAYYDAESPSLLINFAFPRMARIIFGRARAAPRKVPSVLVMISVVPEYR